MKGNSEEVLLEIFMRKFETVVENFIPGYEKQIFLMI